MKQVAERPCQVRIEGKILTLYKGDTVDYPDEHPNLRAIEGETAKSIDFALAGEDELFETEFDLDDIKEYIVNVYNVAVRVKSKKKLIEKLLDCRYRALSDADTNRLG